MREYSAGWLDAMEKEAAFRKTIMAYQTDTDKGTIKRDILTAFQRNSIVDGRIVFDGGDADLIVTRLMSEGYFLSHIIELVWRELVGQVFEGRDEAAAWAVDALARLEKRQKAELRLEMSELVFEHAERQKEDELALRLGERLLREMGYEEERGMYAEKYIEE